MIDYRVELITFPSSKAHEAICENEDMSYTIFLDARENYETQKKRFLHAMKHIYRDDFAKECIQEIETEAHHE